MIIFNAMNPRLSILSVLLVLVSVSLNAGSKDGLKFDDNDFSLVCELSESTFYQSQPVTVNVVLCSPTPDIAGVRELSPLHLSNGDFSFFSPVRVDSRPYVKEVKGEKVYCFTVASYVMTLPEKGKFRLEGLRLAVGVSYPAMVHDPFWGYVQTSRTEELQLVADPVAFRVRELPAVPDSTLFSGAVGDFSVDVTIPPGNIIVNEEAVAVITVKGSGWLPDDMLPEYRNAFKSPLQLKSISESRNRYVSNGKLISELQLECTFIPTSRDGAFVGAVTFEYFNPSKGKYFTASSSPVDVNVKSSTIRREAVEI